MYMDTCTWIMSCNKEALQAQVQGVHGEEKEPGGAEELGGKSSSNAWPWCGADVKAKMGVVYISLSATGVLPRAAKS